MATILIHTAAFATNLTVIVSLIKQGDLHHNSVASYWKHHRLSNLVIFHYISEDFLPGDAKIIKGKSEDAQIMPNNDVINDVI